MNNLGENIKKLGFGLMRLPMKDEKIDFYKQIEIQNETKKFLQRYQSFGQYEQKIYNKIISGYINSWMMGLLISTQLGHMQEVKMP